MSSILTDDDIKGIAAHYAYQKGRPVVFITVPEQVRRQSRVSGMGGPAGQVRRPWTKG